jgi:hypothetical protein
MVTVNGKDGDVTVPTDALAEAEPIARPVASPWDPEALLMERFEGALDSQVAVFVRSWVESSV